MSHPLQHFNTEKVDLNKAFANNWDKKNPSLFKQSCDHSRQLREDYEYQKKTNEQYMNTLETLKKSQSK
jgi:hypothetical protein